MISKMKFINIVGATDSYKRIISDYIMDSSIEFENPMIALKNTKGFAPNTDGNPAEPIMKRFMDVFDYANIDYNNIKCKHNNFSTDELQDIINDFDNRLHSLKNDIERYKGEIEKSKKMVDVFSLIVSSNIHMEDLNTLKYLKYRFGRLPMSNYKKLDTYLKDLPVYFEVMSSDVDYVLGLYFINDNNKEDVDRAFAALHFERIWLENESGTPAEIVTKLKKEIQEKEYLINDIDNQIDETIKNEYDKLIKAFADIKYDYELYNIRKYTTNSRNSFCVVGWVTEDEAEKILEKTKDDAECMVVVDDPKAVSHITPPTKLKNLKIFKPFEEFVRMYGVPNYNEIDPTPFLAIVYTLLFGIMFGDVGHGLCLALIGVLMTLLKKGGFLAKLLIPIGISSAIFGGVYGSIFGLEGENGLIKPIWFTPFENSSTMMNTLIYSVIIGVVLILICMIFNIINGVKQKDYQKIIFSQNGIAGMVFYVLVLFCAISAISGAENPLWIAGIFIAVSLVMIFLQKPLGRLLEKKKALSNEEKGGFFVEAFFETFEIVLSFITNTVSFLRVGAFALNHAGMMSVVVMFMMKLSLGGSIAITIFGNLLVIGLEGLIVGIQVLRLGFYEMFSRFYLGDGREFKPFIAQENKD